MHTLNEFKKREDNINQSVKNRTMDDSIIHMSTRRKLFAEVIHKNEYSYSCEGEEDEDENESVSNDDSSSEVNESNIKDKSFKDVKKKLKIKLSHNLESDHNLDNSLIEIMREGILVQGERKQVMVEGFSALNNAKKVGMKNTMFKIVGLMSLSYIGGALLVGSNPMLAVGITIFTLNASLWVIHNFVLSYLSKMTLGLVHRLD